MAAFASGIGDIMKGVGTYATARAEHDEAKFISKQHHRRAKQIEAAGGREAKLERKKGDLLKSRATAVMAAQGGGVDTERLADIETKTKYNELAALYEARVEANTERQAGRATTFGSRLRKGAARTTMLSSAVTGGYKMANSRQGETFKDWLAEKMPSKKVHQNYTWEDGYGVK